MFPPHWAGFIFNEGIPQDLGYVDRENRDNDLVPEINFLVAKKQLKQIIDKCIHTHGATKTAEVLTTSKQQVINIQQSVPSLYLFQI